MKETLRQTGKGFEFLLQCGRFEDPDYLFLDAGAIFMCRAGGPGLLSVLQQVSPGVVKPHVAETSSWWNLKIKIFLAAT